LFVTANALTETERVSRETFPQPNPKTPFTPISAIVKACFRTKIQA